MITNFSIKNSIPFKQLDLPLSDLTVITGHNNTNIDNITALSNPIQNVIPRVYVDYKIIFPNLSSAKGFLKQIEKSSKNITTNVVTLNSEEFDPYNPMVEIAINCYSGVVQNLEAVPKDWSREYRTIKGSKPINNFAYTEFLEIDLGLNKISNEVKSELVENMLLGLTIPYLILHYDYNINFT